MKNICFYDVDTQHDFMDEKGALYVPGAEEIRPKLHALTRYALDLPYDYTDPESGRRYRHTVPHYEIDLYPILGSVDRHYEGDAELKIFPKHCMDGTEGQKKIPETSIVAQTWCGNAVTPPCMEDAYIENRAHLPQELKNAMSHSAVYFEKQEVSVFSNANANLLTRFDAAVVYGVATEYCVKAAVLGMRQRGIDVLVVEDAIKGITPDGEKAAVEEMKNAGAKFIKTKDVLEGKVEEMLREMWGEQI
ncbi:MAG: isochorismatase family protein [Nanoarchaeota archaeon]|nr:isochorismatase family protein [Nanoarchaeota archaeon]